MFDVSFLVHPDKMVEAQQRLKFIILHYKIKSLVIGCGREIEKGFSSETMPNMVTCSMCRKHQHDILIDIDARGKPDIVMDFGQWRNYDFHNLASEHFNTIDFEYLSNHPGRFTDIEIIEWLKGADELLAKGGVINFINAYPPYVERAKKTLTELLNYELLNDGVKEARFVDTTGMPVKDKNNRIALHRYCSARKK